MEKIKVYGFEMARVSEVYLSTLSNIMTPHGLERYYFPFLYLCKNSGKITQKELSEAIRRDKVYTMRIVDFLCDKGLLVRKQDSSDRRCQLLEVTKKAIDLLPKIQDAINKTENLLLYNFSDEEKQQFSASMDKLFETINTFPDPEFIVHAIKNEKIDK